MQLYYIPGITLCFSWPHVVRVAELATSSVKMYCMSVFCFVLPPLSYEVHQNVGGKTVALFLCPVGAVLVETWEETHPFTLPVANKILPDVDFFNLHIH